MYLNFLETLQFFSSIMIVTTYFLYAHAFPYYSSLFSSRWNSEIIFATFTFRTGSSIVSPVHGYNNVTKELVFLLASDHSVMVYIFYFNIVFRYMWCSWEHIIKHINLFRFQNWIVGDIPKLPKFSTQRDSIGLILASWRSFSVPGYPTMPFKIVARLLL